MHIRYQKFEPRELNLLVISEYKSSDELEAAPDDVYMMSDLFNIVYFKNLSIPAFIMSVWGGFNI